MEMAAAEKRFGRFLFNSKVLNDKIALYVFCPFVLLKYERVGVATFNCNRLPSINPPRPTHFRLQDAAVVAGKVVPSRVSGAAGRHGGRNQREGDLRQPKVKEHVPRQREVSWL